MFPERGEVVTGTITLVYRNPEGVVRSRLMEENQVSLLLRGRPIIERDTKHMDEIFKLEDAYYYHPNAPFQNGMAAPGPFGIVVVDYRANQFMSATSSICLDRFIVSDAINWTRIESVFKRYSKPFFDMPDNSMRIRSRMFKIYQQKTTFIDTMGEPLTLQEAILLLPELEAEGRNANRDRAWNKDVAHYVIERDFIIDYAPLETTFCTDDDHSSLILVLARMKQFGFELSDAEIKAWDEKIVKAIDRGF